MRAAVRIVSLWGPPVLVMGAIFALSSMPSGTEQHGPLYLFVRKAGHFCEYALLCACWWRLLRTRASAGGAAAGAFALAVAFAATDEYHQTFVTNRVGSPLDVLIDAAGAAAAAALLAYTGDGIHRRLRRGSSNAPTGAPHLDR